MMLLSGDIGAGILRSFSTVLLCMAVSSSRTLSKIYNDQNGS